MQPETRWWQTTSIYQVYPRSFCDSNGDGIGDLRGVISKLDYIRDLGFETIWLSPFFCSPQADCGYDISDYQDVAPEYGDLADVSNLLEAAHRRGLRVLFDLVLNHTSEEHPWFRESRRSRENPKRDWYLWRSGHGDHPPNNWQSLTGGSGWHLDERTDQWYYASFLPFQPDLNHRNPAVRAALLDVVRFWLGRGVDGFRLDIFHTLYKDEKFRDNPLSHHCLPYHDVAGFFQQWKYNLNLPETQAFAAELRSFVEAHAREPLLLGEVFGDPGTVRAYLGERQEGLNLIFLWELPQARACARSLHRVLEDYERDYPPPFTPVYVLGNHDRKRVLSRVDGDVRVARLLALLQFTARGVPVTYYGEEIGMADGELSAATALDPLARHYARVPAGLLDALGIYVNRDGCRTPMQWSSGKHAGFSQGPAAPWLPVNPDYGEVNVAAQQQDPGSLLNTYRDLLRLRRANPALNAGSLSLEEPDGQVLSYQRERDGHRVLVGMNFSNHPARLRNDSPCHQPLLAIGMEPPAHTDEIHLPPYAGVVLGNRG